MNTNNTIDTNKNTSKKVLSIYLSTMLLYSSLLLAPISQKNEIGKILSRFFNETRGIRTPDNLIKSQVLYQLS